MGLGMARLWSDSQLRIEIRSSSPFNAIRSFGRDLVSDKIQGRDGAIEIGRQGGELEEGEKLSVS